MKEIKSWKKQEEITKRSFASEADRVKAQKELYERALLLQDRIARHNEQVNLDNIYYEDEKDYWKNKR